MASYDDATMQRIPPQLEDGEKERIAIAQDESVFHTNEYRRRLWLGEGQQRLIKKGNGQAIHVSDFICEPSGRLKLNNEELTMVVQWPNLAPWDNT